MNCKYKIGDAFLSISMWVSLLGLAGANAVNQHPFWWALVGFLVLMFFSGVALNRNERKREKIQAIRAQRQLDLGVPPDETQI